MIPLLLLTAAAAGAPMAKPAQAPAPTHSVPAPTALEQKYDQCLDLIGADAVKAVAFANQWQIENGGVAARQCLGLAYISQGRWLSAMTSFEQAAQIAERNRDPKRAARLWVLAGNAALGGAQPAKARTYLETALASGTLTGLDAGEAYLDHARALVMMRDVKGARTSIDQALKLAPADPLAWLLSATLARREGNLLRAETDIAEALNRAPDDASVALEAGNIALINGAPKAAKTAWEAAVRLSPNSAAGIAAKDALKQFEAPPAK
jgi:tetratricopeptide (TPR) repeat protein